MMEKQGYRETYESLSTQFPGRVTISVKEAAEAMGVNVHSVYASAYRAKDPLPFQCVGKKQIVIPIPAFARWLCGQ